MKVSSFVGIMVIAFSPLLSAENVNESPTSSTERTKEPGCHTETVPNKVKLLKARYLILDGEYYVTNQCVYEIIKVNETYNRRPIDYERIKELPANVELRVEVYRSNSECDNYQRIRDITFPLCLPSKYDTYLEDSSLALKKSGKCLEKRHFISSDGGYFKFYDLLSKKELKNAKFILIRSYLIGHRVINRSELEFVSNVL